MRTITTQENGIRSGDTKETKTWLRITVSRDGIRVTSSYPFFRKGQAWAANYDGDKIYVTRAKFLELGLDKWAKQVLADSKYESFKSINILPFVPHEVRQ